MVSFPINFAFAQLDVLRNIDQENCKDIDCKAVLWIDIGTAS
jgi:hypothetical protein